MSTVDAERTLEQLLEDRAMLHRQLDQLKAQLEQNDVGAEDRIAMEEDLKQLQRDTDLRMPRLQTYSKRFLILIRKIKQKPGGILYSLW